MARHTRIKLAALATSLVAALGVMAISPATASHAGGSHVSRLTDRHPHLLLIYVSNLAVPVV